MPVEDTNDPTLENMFACCLGGYRGANLGGYPVPHDQFAGRVDLTRPPVEGIIGGPLRLVVAGRSHVSDSFSIPISLSLPLSLSVANLTQANYLSLSLSPYP